MRVKIAPSELLLRLSVAIAFLYPPIDALMDPYSWVGYFPKFVTDIVAPHSILLLHAFGIVEIGIALWILFGKRIWIPCIIAAVLLLAIVAVNPAQFAILFRDLAIALATLALALINWNKARRLAHAGS